jgi:hypothetical protein
MDQEWQARAVGSPGTELLPAQAGRTAGLTGDGGLTRPGAQGRRPAERAELLS